MTRKLARIVQIDSVVPIDGADSIESAKVGGWTVVVKKGEYKPGDLAVYFEIDSFLPEGKEAWKFLTDKSSRVFNNVKGHVLRSIKLRGQVSQGLLLPLRVDSLFDGFDTSHIDVDVSDILRVTKYEPPVPAELSGIARGAFPLCVQKTDQERIQNLAPELAEFVEEDYLTWEVTEKLEGSSCTFAWIENDLHVCSRNIDLLCTEGNSFWGVAKELDIQNKLTTLFFGKNLALQGELVGPGVQGNIYSLTKRKFFLFDVYDIDRRKYMSPSEREEIAKQLGLEQVPILDKEFRIPQESPMASLLAFADGPSQLKNTQLREGLVFKSNQRQMSFKVVSNKYLLKQSAG